MLTRSIARSHYTALNAQYVLVIGYTLANSNIARPLLSKPFNVMGCLIFCDVSPSLGLKKKTKIFEIFILKTIYLYSESFEFSS